MHITDHDDRPISNYNPIIDTEIDIDAPYIDWSHVENIESIIVPANGVYDTLYYIDKKILTVNEVAEIEIRFYTSDVPNENYRIGQRHIKGKVKDIKLSEGASDSYGGFILSFDASLQWNGTISNVNINKSYVEITKTRCIVILYFDENGKIYDELVIPINDWFSAKVYLNTSFIIPDVEQYPFKVGDIVDTTVYIKDTTLKTDTASFTVIEKEYTGRLDELSLIKKEYITDENGFEKRNVIFYYLVTIDQSEEYQYSKVKLASTVIKSMKLHKLPDPEP